jgi:hypothetical protein
MGPKNNLGLWTKYLLLFFSFNFSLKFFSKENKNRLDKDREILDQSI